MKVVLDTDEKRVCRWIARERYKNNRNNKVANRKVGPQGNFVTDLNGIGGEIAFCRLFKCDPDLSLGVRSGSCDTVLNGKRVDIKTTKYQAGKLIAAMTKDIKDIDVFALMVGKFPEYEYKGWAWARELMTPENVKDLGHGECYALEQSKLNR